MASPRSTQIRARLALKKQVVAHLNQDEVTTRTLLTNLVVRGFVSERTVEDEAQSYYQVRMETRRRREFLDVL
jgi:hypothetical protein